MPTSLEDIAANIPFGEKLILEVVQGQLRVYIKLEDGQEWPCIRCEDGWRLQSLG